MTARSLVTFCVAVAAAGLIVGLVPGVPDALVAVVGVVVVLLVPGLALLLALRTPVREPGPLIVFVLGGSLALLVVVGVVLAALPWGLTATTAPVTLEVLAIVLAGSALLGGSPAETIVSWPPIRARRSWPVAALFALALAVAGAAVVIAHVAADRTDAVNEVSQFSAVPVNGGAGLRIMIENHQPDATSFRVEVSVASSQDTRQVILARRLRVPDGHRTAVRIALPDHVSASSARSSLFVAGHVKPIRVVGAAP